MAYKKLSEATFVESVSDEATVLVEENDQIKRVPKKTMGKVKTVNGAEPDENGNVKVEIPEATWESLPDKPFYETNLISWDGNTEGKDSVTADIGGGVSATFFKVCDETFSANDLIGATMSVSGVEDNQFPLPPEATIGDDGLGAYDIADDCALVASDFPLVISVKNSGAHNISPNPDYPVEVDFPSAGTYVLYATEFMGETFTPPVFCSNIVGVKPIDKKYLPEDVGGVNCLFYFGV